jgi:hypothetical protein
MKAAAQPTPELTANAFVGQFKAQAPHSIQASLSTKITFPSRISKTP